MTAPQRDARPQVVSVTTARLSHSEDVALRERRYMLMQMARIAVFVLGVALPVPIPVKALLFVGAVFLPLFGVVMANAGPTVMSKRQQRNAIAQGLTETPAPERIALDSRVVDG